MARLNPASPVKPAKLQERRTPPQNRLSRTATIKREPRDRSQASSASQKDNAEREQWAAIGETWSKSRSTTTAVERPRVKNRLQRADTVSSGTFDIFSESDGLSETENSSFSSSSRSLLTEDRTTDPLKLSQVNSLLLPLSHQPRNRSPRKSVGYNYDKENDPVDGEEQEDEGSSLSRNSSTASNRPAARTIARQTPPRGRSRTRYRDHQQPETKSDDEGGENGFDSMDDFIVSDNEEISYHETSDDETSEQEEKQPTPSPPRTRKRLLRGRRPDLGMELTVQDASHNGSLHLEPSVPATLTRAVPRLDTKPKKLFQSELEVLKKLNGLKLNQEEFDQLNQNPNEDTDQIDSPTKKSQSSKSGLETPPSSPSKRCLPSPTKSRVHIPPTPHRESVDAFWSQETTNNWVDQYSPCKIDLLPDFDESEIEDIDTDIMLRPVKKNQLRLIKLATDTAVGEEDSDIEATDTKIVPKTAKTSRTPVGALTKTPSKTALRKAEADKRKAEKARKQGFINKRQAMAEEFLKVLDNTVTGGRIRRLTAPTGGVSIVWKSFRTTAGRARWHVDNTSSEIHHAVVELGTSVIDAEDRLIKTLAHEFCHLANYMISGVLKDAHGKSFYQWADKVKESLKDHPIYGRHIEITTNHDYDIDYKYVWRCVDCSMDYKRHSKSIDVRKHRCGTCKGLLQQIKPKPRNISPLKKATPFKKPTAGLVNQAAQIMKQVEKRTYYVDLTES
ncbi:hypothetical protein BO94DRAFT_563051 [Aspergillus sclerotioniger CBS 115572]|uniref:SprT-like domain-containing protein n=1 Tax=Aspergillus sclerotioniger CBS 115572 TaxID=1450535 RepID=A0A317X732_9EURO|nr:hypothetical protein BO94DRAFT_563051 [Aspergillus sclerotioniger CBS 115572]PWY94393.1 hypothetical protein BO94DRAFT_563051 [Aspergillus sclerotioniger CBS 115572]